MADETEMSLIVSFTDQSEGFVHGFEAGMIWQQMDVGVQEIDCGYETGIPMHTANVQVVQRMAEAKGYRFETKPQAFSEWTAARLIFVGSGRTKPVLSVVGDGDGR